MTALTSLRRRFSRNTFVSRANKSLLRIFLKRKIGVQLSLAKRWRLPLFLHSRAAHADFVRILREEGFGEDGGRKVGANGGVVHSFTGTIEEAAELVRPNFLLYAFEVHDIDR